GNKEYKIKATFTDAALNSSYAVDNSLYDGLYEDLQVLNIIDSYYAYNGNHSWTYGTANGGATNVADHNTNPMTKAIKKAGLNGATLWNTFCLELQATATTTFEDVYEDSAAFRSAVREL